MIGKYSFITVDKNNFNLNYIKNKERSKNFKEFDDLLEDKKIKSKKLYVLIEGEEVYIKELIIPKVKGKKINKILNNELLYEFNSLEDILYCYKIKNKNKRNMNILMFCVNIYDKLYVKKILNNKFNVKGIYLVQFVILNYYMKYIKENKFKFLLKYKDYIYFIVCDKDKIIYNSVIKEDERKNILIKKELLKEEFKMYNKIYCVFCDTNFLKDVLDEFEVVYLKKSDKDLKKIYKKIIRSKVII